MEKEYNLAPREVSYIEDTAQKRCIHDLKEPNRPFILYNKIVEFLTAIPNLYEGHAQRAFLYSVGLDKQLQNQIHVGIPPAQFFQLLVSRLENYGMLQDGRNALKAVLEAAKNYVGQERREYCDMLIQELHTTPHVKEHPLPPHLAPLNQREGQKYPSEQQHITTGRDCIEHAEHVYSGIAYQQNIQTGLSSTCPYPLQRPPRVEHFTGRESEIDQLLRVLQPGHVITLCGPGGIGKTALAIEAVRQLDISRFPDGIVFYSFYGRPNIDLAFEHIVASFGVESKPTPKTAALRVLADKQALLFLDGTEETNDLRSVLEVRGECGVLITSRSNEDAEEEWLEMTTLQSDEAVKLLQVWGGEFTKNEDIAEQICELAGRLPLAVRLVGRYLAHRKQNAEKFLSWLQSSPLKALDHGKRREKSVPVLLERSLKQVSPEAQQALAVTGILALSSSFNGNVVAEALDISDFEAENLLGELVSYGLLFCSDGRYEVSHPLIHTYVRKFYPLSPIALERLAVYYTIFVNEQEEQGLANYVNIDTERAHLMQVMKDCQEKKNWHAVSNLVMAVDIYLDMRGYWTERQIALEIGVNAAQNLYERRDEERFLGNLGHTCRNLGQIEHAITTYEQTLAISRQIGDRKGETMWLGTLSDVYRALGKIKQAIMSCEQALIISREIADQQEEVKLLGKLGHAYRVLGRTKQAMTYYRQALTISQQIDYRQGEGEQLGYLGEAYRNLGQVKQAIDYYEQALSIYQEIDDRQGEAKELNMLAVAHWTIGKIEKAIMYLEHVLAIYRKIGNRRGEGATLGNLGVNYHTLGKTEQTMMYYKQALAIDQEIGNRQGEGRCLHNLGDIYHTLGQIEQAMECHKQALALSRKAGDRRFGGYALNGIGTAYCALGQQKQAIMCYEQALIISQEVGDRRLEGYVLNDLGIVYCELGQMKQAITCHEQALIIHQEIDYRLGEGECLNGLGNTYCKLRHEEKAVKFYEQALIIHQETGNFQGKGEVLGGLGNTYRNLGQLEKAIKFYEQALIIHREIGYRMGEGKWLKGIGEVYHALKQVEKANQYVKQSLTIFMEIRSPYADSVRKQLAEFEY